MKNWSKTLLSSYRYLSTIVETIDEMVKKISLYSMYYNRKSNSDTLSQIKKLIDLNDRKTNLTNLKVIIDECLGELSVKDLQFVSLFYIDGLDFEEVSECMEVSIRTVFRRKKVAMDKFCQILAKKYSTAYFFQNYTEEQWLIDLYNYYLKKSLNEKQKQNKLYEEMDTSSIDNGKYIFDTIKSLKRVVI